MFLVCLSFYLKSKELIYMKLLPDVCFEPRNNRLYFRDHPDYDTDTRSGLRSRHHGLVLKYI